MIDYHVAPADALPFVASQSIDVVTIVLALQNIEAMQAVMAEASRVLKVGGRFIIVINHLQPITTTPAQIRTFN